MEKVAGYVELKLATTSKVGAIQRNRASEFMNERRRLYVPVFEWIDGVYGVILKKIGVFVASSVGFKSGSFIIYIGAAGHL